MAALRAPVSECAPARSGGTTAQTRPTACHPRFTRWGWRVARLRFDAAGRGPTLLPFLAPQRGMRSTSCCHPAAVEGVGWGMGPGIFWCQGGGGGLGPPPTTRFLPAMRLVGGAWKSHNLGPLVVARGPGYGLLRFKCGGSVGPHGRPPCNSEVGRPPPAAQPARREGG